MPVAAPAACNEPRDRSGPEGLANPRKLGQLPRDAQVLARGARVQPTAPGEPLGARAADEPAAPVELRHEFEPPARPRVDVRRQRRQLVLELTNRETGRI